MKLPEEYELDFSMCNSHENPKYHSPYEQKKMLNFIWNQTHTPYTRHTPHSHIEREREREYHDRERENPDSHSSPEQKECWMYCHTQFKFRY